MLNKDEERYVEVMKVVEGIGQDGIFMEVMEGDDVEEDKVEVE